MNTVVLTTLVLTKHFVSCTIIAKINPDNTQLESCISRVAKNVFDDKDIYYVFDLHDDLFFQVNNPKLIVMINDPFPQTYKYGKNFVIQTADATSLDKTLYALFASGIWDKIRSPRGTYIIITTSSDLQGIFELLWKKYIIKAGVVLYDGKNNAPKIYTSDIFEEENNCGTTPRVFDEHSCNSSLAVVVFPRLLPNYHGCPVVLAKLPQEDVRVIRRPLILRNLTLNLLVRTFNVSVRLANLENLDEIHSKFLRNETVMYAAPRHYLSQDFEESEVIGSENWAWVLPMPKRVSAFEVYLIIFRKEVWVLTLMAFLVTVFFLLCINRGEIDFARRVLDVVSIALNGAPPKLAGVDASKFIIVSYVVFCMHLQTAYVSKLVQVLTIPQYKRGIANLEELAESNFSVYINAGYKNYFFKKAQPENIIYSKMQKKLIEIYNSSGYTDSIALEFVVDHNNCSAMINERIAIAWQMSKKLKLKNKLLVDTSLVGKLEDVFVMAKGHYFMNVINKAIAVQVENGMRDFQVNLVEDKLRLRFVQMTETRLDVVALSLKHIYGIFVLFVVGLFVSLVTFFVEIWAGKNVHLV